MVVKPEQTPLPLASWYDDGFNLLEAREPGAASGGLESCGLCWTLPSRAFFVLTKVIFKDFALSCKLLLWGHCLTTSLYVTFISRKCGFENKTIKTVNEWIENEVVPGPRDLLMSRCIPE